MDTVRSPISDATGARRLDETRAMAAHIGATLRTSEALLRAARSIDLRGLQAEVGRLCAATLDLPPDQGRQMRPSLDDLLARLDAVEAVLRQGAP